MLNVMGNLQDAQTCVGILFGMNIFSIGLIAGISNMYNNRNEEVKRIQEELEKVDGYKDKVEKLERECQDKKNELKIMERVTNSILDNSLDLMVKKDKKIEEMELNKAKEEEVEVDNKDDVGELFSIKGSVGLPEGIIFDKDAVEKNILANINRNMFKVPEIKLPEFNSKR